MTMFEIRVFGHMEHKKRLAQAEKCIEEIVRLFGGKAKGNLSDERYASMRNNYEDAQLHRA